VASESVPQAAESDDPPRPGRVRTDRSCGRCGYNLRGLSASDACPECGYEVALSLRGGELRHAAPEYLREVHTGAFWILVAGPLDLLAFVGGALLAAGLGPKAHWVFEAASIPTSLLLAWAYWKYTAPDMGLAAGEQPRAARRVLRTAIACMVALSLAGAAGAMLGARAQFTPGMPHEQLAMASAAAAISLGKLAAHGVRFFAALRYTRWLADRVPDPALVARTRRAAWLLPVVAVAGTGLCGVGWVVALVMYWRMINTVRAHLRRIRFGGEPPRTTDGGDAIVQTF